MPAWHRQKQTACSRWFRSELRQDRRALRGSVPRSPFSSETMAGARPYQKCSNVISAMPTPGSRSIPGRLAVDRLYRPLRVLAAAANGAHVVTALTVPAVVHMSVQDLAPAKPDPMALPTTSAGHAR